MAGCVLPPVERSLKLEASNFKCCLLALGESTGVSDTAQLVIFVLGADKRF